MIFELIQNNQFLQGLLITGGLGAAAMWSRSGLAWVAAKIKRVFSSTITLNSQDSSLYPEICDYIFSLKSFQNLKTLLLSDKGGVYRGDDPAKVVISPADGFYIGRVGWRPIWVHISSESRQTGGKTYMITLGAVSWGPSFLEDRVKKIISEREASEFVNIQVSEYSYLKRKKRSLDSVFLENGLKEQMVAAIQRFLNSEDEYHRMGIPYGLNILLTGRPGVGKTSLLFALASHFGMKIYFAGAGTSDISPISECSRKTMIVLEDIDSSSFKVDREDADISKTSLSTLLNLLDGLRRPEGCVIVLTSNHPEKLDPALTRDGRIDKKYELKYFSREFAEKVSQDLIGEVVDIGGESEICPATLISKIHSKRA